MLINLIRNTPTGNAVTGRLMIDGRAVCDTLENADHIIPTGTYPVRLTMSPRFGEVLPLLDHVVGRTGIRIHPGNTTRDSSGCILVGSLSPLTPLPIDGEGECSQRLMESRKTFNALRETLLTTQRNHETIYITIEEYDPYPLYDEPCPKHERMYND